MTAYLSPDPALTTRRQNHMRAWAQRQREKESARLADLTSRGVTGYYCPACDTHHRTLYAGPTCRAAHPELDGEICGADLIEVHPTLSLSNGLGGTAQVRYSVNGGRA